MLLPALGRRVLHDGDGGVRPRRAAPDAGLRDDRPRPRHEQLDVRRVPVPGRSRSTAARCSTPAKLQGARRAGAATRTWTATASRTGRCPGDGMPAVLHARLRPQREGAVQRAARRLRRQHGPARAEVRDGADAACRSRWSTTAPAPTVGIIGYGTSHWAIDESRDQLATEAGRRRRPTCGCAPTRSPRSSTAFIDAHERVYVVEQNRDAQMLQLLQHGRSTPSAVAKLRSVLHYDGLPIDARSDHRRRAGAGRRRSRDARDRARA